MKSEPWSQWLAQTCSRHARAESALGKECRRAEGAPSVPYPLPPPLYLSPSLLSPPAPAACRCRTHGTRLSYSRRHGTEGARFTRRLPEQLTASHASTRQQSSWQSNYSTRRCLPRRRSRSTSQRR